MLVTLRGGRVRHWWSIVVYFVRLIITLFAYSDFFEPFLN